MQQKNLLQLLPHLNLTRNKAVFKILEEETNEDEKEIVLLDSQFITFKRSNHFEYFKLIVVIRKKVDTPLIHECLTKFGTLYKIYKIT